MKRFTLLELIAVTAIIAILVTMLLPSLAKARSKAQIAVCISNLKQIHHANSLYLHNNNYRFPLVRGSNIDDNTGRLWVGIKGNNSDYFLDVTQRPLNQYLGYTKNGITDMPVARCPVGSINSFKAGGTSYMGAARIEHNDDLDLSSNSEINGGKTLFLSEVKQPSIMNFMGEVGGWHYTYNTLTIWPGFNHEKKLPYYTFSFVDGSVKYLKVFGGMGISSNSKILNFRNF